MIASEAVILELLCALENGTFGVVDETVFNFVLAVYV